VFERFTEGARQVVVRAQEEAARLEHGYIGTEHLLLALIGDEDGLAGRVLASLDVSVEPCRAVVARLVGAGDNALPGQLPFTSRVRTVLELSLREALSLKHDHIATEHVLLGLIREGQGVGIRLLLDLGVDPASVRAAVFAQAEWDTPISLPPGLSPDPRYPEGTLARAAELADLSGRAVDAADMFLALAETDELVREVLTRYVTLDELTQALEDHRQRGRGWH
jgi:ATP-dependent Clp protease ATP-binding subunit ClpA